MDEKDEENLDFYENASFINEIEEEINTIENEINNQHEKQSKLDKV
jgi:hypothetical protein